RMGEALEIVNTMWEHDITPDIITYNIILDELCKSSSSDNVLETFKAMMEKGCIPNAITYNILIESFCKARKLARAVEFLNEIQQNDCMRQLKSYTLWCTRVLSPEAVKTVFEADKKEVAAPKIVVEDLLRKSHITYYAYEVLHEAIRDKKLLKEKA
ncbi:UNVERIFIED_CONTAM: putative pentatricopeptide repeat-containing protein, partial [Sesamum radiatum]